MSVEGNKAVVAGVLEALNESNLAGLDEFCSAEFAKELRGQWESIPFSDHRFEVTDMVAEGDKVVAVVATSGVHSGEWEGLPPSGKSWTNTGVLICSLDAGKIEGVTTFFDELGHLKQLGATVTPPHP